MSVTAKVNGTVFCYVQNMNSRTRLSVQLLHLYFSKLLSVLIDNKLLSTKELGGSVPLADDCAYLSL